MLNVRNKIILGALLIFGIFLRSTSFTSADLFAQRIVQNNHFSVTTLSFDSLNTANNFTLTRLFDITGLVPGGFAVNSLRIKKAGLMNFKYFLKTEVISGDSTFCQSLDLQLMQNGVFKTKSDLISFNYQSAVDSDSPQDWVLFLDLNHSDATLRHQNCQFNLVVTTQSQTGSNKGIFATRVLQNNVSSGNWD